MSTKLQDPVDVHVGRRIKMRRMMLNLSQSDLGKNSKITFQQVQKYEKGTNRVSASRLQEFLKALDVPVSFFFDGLASNGTKVKSAPEELAQQLLSTREGIELTKAFMSIDDKSLRRSIVATVESIANQETAQFPSSAALAGSLSSKVPKAAALGCKVRKLGHLDLACEAPARAPQAAPLTAPDIVVGVNVSPKPSAAYDLI